jgi:hypothetical protein
VIISVPTWRTAASGVRCDWKKRTSEVAGHQERQLLFLSSFRDHTRRFPKPAIRLRRREA